MAESQQRVRERQILEDARLPANATDNGGKVISERCLKRMLESVASFGPTCWASVRAIGERKNYGERQTRSALQALEKLRVLECNVGCRSATQQHPIVERRIDYSLDGLLGHCSDDLRTGFGQLRFVKPDWQRTQTQAALPTQAALLPTQAALLPTQAALLPTQAALLPTQAALSADPGCTQCRRTQNETQKELRKVTQSEAAEFREIHFPDLDPFDLSKAIDLANVHALLVACGLAEDSHDDLERVLQTAAVATRCANDKPRGYFRKVWFDGFGKFGLADVDRGKAKRMLRELRQ